jgi:LuxR family maltose regulon positive regulatory protein
MPVPILATKLYIPPFRPKTVLRPRLIERINEGLHRRLTLISAPPGFGKTTLAGEWVAGCKGPAAWLSLDEGDNDTTRFLTYLIAALQTIAENIGEGVLALLQTPHPPPVESLLTVLINEITVFQENITVILDDYHVIDNKSIDAALTFLLENLPPQVHLIIATREDPCFPLPRLRARGQLNELRAADLRFSISEATDFINRMMGLNLSAENITELETRTEGWIAGLQLAALSMQGHKDIAGFIKSFAGSHHYIMDYLVEEVLQKQSENVKTFLLYTSILDRLCGSLCDAVMRDPSVFGQKTLEYIEHANLFIVPLDHERRWYRYHHLFADLLRQRLHQLAVSTPEGKGFELSDLHIRASIWYAENDLRTKALHHAFAANDLARAANLIELAWPEMDQSYQNDTWLVWLKKLPEEMIRLRPILCAGYAWALLDKGEVDDVEPLLRNAEQWLDASTETSECSKDPSTQMVVADQKQFQSLPASIADARATRALILGNVSETLNYAHIALDIVPKDDHFRRGAIAGTLGITYWTCGDLEKAYRHLNDCRVKLQMAGNIHLASGVTFVLADIRQVQGRLREAVCAYESSLQLVAASDKPVPLASADLYLGLSGLNREQGDMEAAARHLLKSKELGELAALPGWQYRWHLAQVRIKEDQGDLDAALRRLYDAEHLDFAPLIPDLRPIAAIKARVWLRQGKLTKSLDWAREQGVSFNDDLSFIREYDHITLARVLIAEYMVSRSDRSIVEAAELLKRLKNAAEEGGRMGSVIEILVLQALVYQAQDNIPLALTPFARALSLAKPEGYVRIFVDEGIEMTRLLSEAAAKKIIPDYVSSLQALFETEKQKSKDKSSISSDPPAQPLIEPLSKRELEVLRLIAQGLSNRAIGERLFVALDTVKGHNRNIFGKLQVQRRTEAVARARELGLL